MIPSLWCVKRGQKHLMRSSRQPYHRRSPTCSCCGWLSWFCKRSRRRVAAGKQHDHCTNEKTSNLCSLLALSVPLEVSHVSGQVLSVHVVDVPLGHTSSVRSSCVHFMTKLWRRPHSIVASVLTSPEGTSRLAPSARGVRDRRQRECGTDRPLVRRRY